MTFAFKKSQRLDFQKIQGWGRNTSAYVNINEPKNIKEVQELVDQSGPYSLISRGLGRSYGDAAQLDEASVLELSNFKKLLIDPIAQELTVDAGLSFEEILLEIIPKGFFLPVTPGTKYITVGGAIAADVYGKNHHRDGSFGNHIKKIVLINGEGKITELHPTSSEKLNTKSEFWATVGGMGLTGVIVQATFSLIPINTSLMSVDTYKFDNLEKLMNAMITHDQKYRYSVAWIDSLNKQGRGILTCGEHANLDDLHSKEKDKALDFNTSALGEAPQFLPNGLLNSFTVRAFNEAWYRKAPISKIKELQKISNYFYPLDSIKKWNYIYGPRGFIQYQFVVPDSASNLIPSSLAKLRELGSPSFLTVLKRFGTENSGYLSFPIKGWTLAIDIPASLENLHSTLNELDKEISSAGGKIYLAKDSMMSAEIFRTCYPKFNQWKKIKTLMDPENKFTSDLAKRLRM